MVGSFVRRASLSAPDARRKFSSAPELSLIAVVAIYALGLAFVAVMLGTWTDEEYTLATTAHGVAYAWNRAIDFEAQAPLYFAVLALWREANSSVWFARLFSILCAAGFLLALVPLLRRITPLKNTIPAALLIALNPFVISCAFNVRLYAFALLVSTLSYAAFDRGFLSGTSTRARLTFVALGIVALYTQYFLGFALAGYAVMLVVRGKVRSLVPYTLALIAIAIACVPVLGMLRGQIGTSGETTAAVTSLLHETLVHPWLQYVLPYDRTLDTIHVRTLYLALFWVLAFAIVLARPRLSPTLLGWFACAATIEIIFVIVELLFRLDLGPRHYVVLFFPALMTGYALVQALLRGRFPFVAPIVVWTYAILSFSVLFVQQHSIAQDGDAKRVAAYLETHAAHDAVIAIFPADALQAYSRQYHGSARLVPFPKPLPAHRYDIESIGVHDAREARTGIASLRYAKQAWLVMMGDCREWSRQFGCDDLLDALDDSGKAVTERGFYDARVFSLTTKK